MEQEKGVLRTFPIFGRTLVVPERLDLFNSYRLRFRETALRLTDAAESAYHTYIHDFDSFIEHFIGIYRCMLEPAVKEAFDILISNGAWNINYEAFWEQHIADFHRAVDDYQGEVDAFNAVLEENQRMRSNIMGYVPNLVGGGFGITGAVKGIAAATAFNLVRDGIEANVLRNANVKPAQRAELYWRINPEILLDHVFLDYWNVSLSLVWTLVENGWDIWYPTDEAYHQSNNIFQNLSHPNFPQDKILDALLDIIRKDPYDAAYYQFMVSRFGETQEINAIKNYFGY